MQLSIKRIFVLFSSCFLLLTFLQSSFASTFIVIEDLEKSSFTDMKNHWATLYVEDLKSKGIVSGKTATTFAPDAALTRAELTKIALKAFGIPEGGISDFKDVPAEQWYSPFIATAKEKGIIGGYSDGTFKPTKPVTRAEALKILLTASGKSLDSAPYAKFTDVKQYEWYAKFVNFASANNLVSGYPGGSFGINKNITRAEIAKITSVLLTL